MPIATNPESRAPYWLKADEETPIERRPVFLVKFLTKAELQKHRELMDAVMGEPDGRKACDLLHEAIVIGVKGWRGVNGPDGKALPFSRESMDHPEYGLTDNELWELAWNYPSAVQLSRVDLKN